jgi:hypothetical protein
MIFLKYNFQNETEINKYTILGSLSPLLSLSLSLKIKLKHREMESP